MIYLIGGAPRTGKSIIASCLMDELSIPWISTDVLRTLVHDLTPKAGQLSKFPLKGFSGNDDLSTLGITEMMQFQLTEAKSLEASIDSFVDHQIGVRDNQIIEGVHLLPEHIRRLMNAPEHRQKIQCVFIACVDKEIQLESMRKNSSHFDWLSGASDKTYASVADFVVAYSQWVQEECKKYDLPCVIRKGQFEQENNEIRRLITT